MKKIGLLYLVISIILCFIAGCSESETITNAGDDKMNNSCSLIVRGTDISDQNYVRLNDEYRYAELPLTAIMKELGAEVEWQDPTKANITFDGKNYILDTTKGSLIESGGTVNILMVAPGSTHGVFYEIIENEFIIDSDSVTEKRSTAPFDNNGTKEYALRGKM